MGGLSTCVEWAVSARCLMAMFLLVCAMLSVSGWLRPPVSNDLLAVEIPFGAGAQRTLMPETLSRASGPVRFPSVGTVLLLVIAFGVWVVAVRQKWFPAVCGVLFGLSIAGNAAALCNHPATIESLEFEIEQAARVRNVLSDRYDSPLSQRSLSAQDLKAPVADGDRAGLTAGFRYLQYGVWLMVLTGAGVLCVTQGGIGRRLGLIAVWGLLGAALALSVCRHRLRGEYLWRQAVRLERQGEFEVAREFARKAVAVVPEFEDLHRTWFLLGQLDYRGGRLTSARRYFHLYQLSTAKDKSAAIHEIDLWGRLSSLPRGTGRLESLPHGILAEDADAGQFPLLAQLSGRLLCDEGLQDYREGRFASAEDKWRRALEMMPSRLDCPFLLALMPASTIQTQPEYAEMYLKPLLPRLRDRALKAEIWSTLGDTYFESGRFEVARSCYRQSLQQFHLPKIINHRALRGLVGM